MKETWLEFDLERFLKPNQVNLDDTAFGVAWSPSFRSGRLGKLHGDRKTVWRGGYQISYQAGQRADSFGCGRHRRIQGDPPTAALLSRGVGARNSGTDETVVSSAGSRGRRPGRSRTRLIPTSTTKSKPLRTARRRPAMRSVIRVSMVRTNWPGEPPCSDIAYYGRKRSSRQWQRCFHHRSPKSARAPMSRPPAAPVLNARPNWGLRRMCLRYPTRCIYQGRLGAHSALRAVLRFRSSI
jgi:hypothetical protein